MSTVYIHPMIVHFPIALLILGAFAALLAKVFHKYPISGNLVVFATYSLMIGAVAAVGAVLSGFLFTKEMVGIMGEIRRTHILFAFISVGCGCVAAILSGLSLFSKNKKSGVLETAALLSALITAAMIGVTGHYGGMMVFGA